jgi:hypothetical protein
VEIYPVVFLLHDHAFPGYWRTPQARDRFVTRVSKSEADDTARTAEKDGAAATKPASAPWSFGSTTLDEILVDINANRLIPLETVNLTARSSIAEAIEVGRSYFEPEEQERFLSMLDIQTARDKGVTPLPIGPRPQ